MKYKKIEEMFESMYKNNAIGHAYLFFNVDYKDIKESLETIISKYIFLNPVDIENNEDIYIVETETNVIKKEKILDLETNIANTSLSNEKKLYIIKDCEKFNESAGNSLLKTLEEPGDNIYAILLTKNIEKVMLTIKSRCQLINANSAEKKEILKSYTIEMIEKAIELICIIETQYTKAIAYYPNKLYKVFEKEELHQILNIMDLFYFDCLNKKNNIKIQYFEEYKDKVQQISDQNSINQLVNKIKIVNSNINLLEYNLNLSLFIDKLLIELGSVMK